MARVYLDANENFTLASKAEVTAAPGGNETVLINPGVIGAVIDPTIERVDLGARLEAYTFKLDGTDLTITLNGQTVATVNVGENPTLAFADGSVKVTMTDLGVATMSGDNGVTTAALSSTPTTYTAAQVAINTTITSGVDVASNAAPVIDPAALTLNATEDIAQAGTVTATDADGDIPTYAFGTAAHGKVDGKADGTYTYTPDANFNGTDTFTVTASDIYNSTVGKVTVTVAPVNDKPVAAADTLAVVAGVPKSDTAVATDVDGDTLTYALAQQGEKGTVVMAADGSYTYTPSVPVTPGTPVTDTFTFTATDGEFTSDPATVTITLNNNAPTALSPAMSAKTGVTQVIPASTLGTDPDAGQTLTISVAPGDVSSGGSAEVPTTGENAGKLVYTSTVGYVGTETVKYTVSDGQGGSSTGTVTFTVASNTGGTSIDDLLYGSSAAENIDGLAGNDTINGGNGADSLTGGGGNDTLNVETSTKPDRELQDRIRSRRLT